MGLFEFVTVMVSITLGLSLARLLDGMAGAALRTERVSLYLPHTLWIATILLIHAAYWWSVWDYRLVEWNFARFLTVNSTPLILFFTSALLMPRDTEAGSIDLREHFFRVRPWLMAGYALATMIWIIDGPFIFTFEPVFNSHRIVQVVGLAAVLWGLGSTSHRVHSIVAWIAFAGNALVMWSRFLPGAFGSTS